MQQRTFQPAWRVTSGWQTARSAGMLTSAALISTTAARSIFVSTQWGAGAAACLGTSWERMARLALILTSVSLDQTQSVPRVRPASTPRAVKSAVRTVYGQALPTPASAWTAVCRTTSKISTPSAVSNVLRVPGPAQRGTTVPPATSWTVSVTLTISQPVPAVPLAPHQPRTPLSVWTAPASTISTPAN